jgi:hypothetical protein
VLNVPAVESLPLRVQKLIGYSSQRPGGGAENNKSLWLGTG